MTNSEAIKELKLMRYNDANTGDMDRALEMAIEALSNFQKQTDSELKTTTGDVSATDVIYRQDAIDALDKRFDDVPMELTTEILQLRRDLRERLPSAEPKTAENGSLDSDMLENKTDRTTGDLISRQALLEDFKTVHPDFKGWAEWASYIIKSQPSAQRTGEWIDRSEGGRILNPWWESHKCDQCGYFGSGAWNYCPYCGSHNGSEL